MRRELIIRGVLEEGPRHLHTVLQTREIGLKLFALLGQSLQFLVGLGLEFIEEPFLLLVDLLPFLIKVGDDLVLLKDQGLLDLGLHLVDE